MIEDQFAAIRSEIATEIATRSPSIAPIAQTKDPRDRIKVNEVPKYDGTDKKGVDEFIQEFIEYCQLIRLNEEYMLTALNVALTGKAILWWRSQKNTMVSWKQVRVALLEAYGDRY